MCVSSSRSSPLVSSWSSLLSSLSFCVFVFLISLVLASLSSVLSDVYPELASDRSTV